MIILSSSIAIHDIRLVFIKIFLKLKNTIKIALKHTGVTYTFSTHLSCSGTRPDARVWNLRHSFKLHRKIFQQRVTGISNLTYNNNFTDITKQALLSDFFVKWSNNLDLYSLQTSSDCQKNMPA